MSKNVQIFHEPTPNPLSLKYIVSESISEIPSEYSNAQAAESSPLASKIFGFPWTSSVFIGTNFITVTKQDWVDWDVLADPLASLIKEHIDNGEPIQLQILNSNTSDEADSPEVRKIKEVIHRDIRPAVAVDGGDIVFHKFENNIVYIYMRGSCSGCPSSTYTLKMGIETRLKEALPQISEVIAL